jgi:hypothetical protein
MTFGAARRTRRSPSRPAAVRRAPVLRARVYYKRAPIRAVLLIEPSESRGQRRVKRAVPDRHVCAGQEARAKLASSSRRARRSARRVAGFMRTMRSQTAPRIVVRMMKKRPCWFTASRRRSWRSSDFSVAARTRKQTMLLSGRTSSSKSGRAWSSSARTLARSSPRTGFDVAGQAIRRPGPESRS